MKPGRQWLFFDADFFDNNFTMALFKRFGPTGPLLFMAFLCACKRNNPEGRITFRSEYQALEAMGFVDIPLVDADGQAWTLDEFWAFTGRFKQTTRTRHGHTLNVLATGWEDWQKSRNRDFERHYERDRKRRWRAQNGRDNVPDVPGTDTETETDIRNRGTTSRKTKPQEPPTYPEWIPDQPVGEPLVNLKDVLGQLRRGEDVDG